MEGAQGPDCWMLPVKVTEEQHTTPTPKAHLGLPNDALTFLQVSFTHLNAQLVPREGMGQTCTR